MSVTFCTCCTFHTGAPSRSRDGMQLHHAFCPAWTMTDNYIYPSNQFPHNGKFNHNPLYRYTFAHFPRPTIFYILHYNDLSLFLDFPHMHSLSATVRHDLAHEFIPPSEYSLYTHTTPAHRRLIRHFTPHLRPHDLGAFRWSVVQAFVLFIHASPLLDTEGCELRTERQWLQLSALAQVFGIRGLFDYAAEGLGAAVERKSKKRKRSRALWEVVGRLRKMMERDPWRGFEDELCSG